MSCHFAARVAQLFLQASRSCRRRLRQVAVAVVAAFVLLSPQSLSAALTFSGDVSLNTGVPTAPVLIGRQSIGTLQLDNGSVFNSGAGQFGLTPTGIGFGTVTGPGTMWTMSSTDVGLQGVGRLDIRAGAAVDTTRLLIGGQFGAHGTVALAGAGSTLLSRSFVTVGADGGGTALLNVSDNAIFNATMGPTTVGTLGRVLLDDGLLRLSSLTNRGLVSGSGEISMLSGGTSMSAGRLQAREGDHLLITGIHGGTFDNQGTIEASGGEIEILRAVSNTRLGGRSPSGGEITLRNATVRIGSPFFSSGPQLRNRGLIASVGGENHFFGAILNEGTSFPDSPEIAVTNNSVMIFHDDVTIQSGMMTVFPGSRATLLEDLSLGSGAMLLADIAGSDVSTGYGEIEVVGNVQLGGQLFVALSNGFTPSAGDSFQILTAMGGLSGTLSLAEAPPLPDRLVWDLEITANQVLLSVVPAPPGDYNLNGTVDAADYIVWRKMGINDQQGYNDWRGNFGATLAAAATLAAVPEPTTALSLVLALISTFAARRRCERPTRTESLRCRPKAFQL